MLYLFAGIELLLKSRLVFGARLGGHGVLTWSLPLGFFDGCKGFVHANCEHLHRAIVAILASNHASAYASTKACIVQITSAGQIATPLEHTDASFGPGSEPPGTAEPTLPFVLFALRAPFRESHGRGGRGHKVLRCAEGRVMNNPIPGLKPT